MDRLEVDLLGHVASVGLVVVRLVVPGALLPDKRDLVPLLELAHAAPVLEDRALAQHLREVVPGALRAPSDPRRVETLEGVKVGADETCDVRVGRDGGEDVVEGRREPGRARGEEGLDVGDAGAVQLLLVLLKEAALVGRVQGLGVEAWVAGEGGCEVVKVGLRDSRREVSTTSATRGDEAQRDLRRTLWSRTASMRSCAKSRSASSLPKLPLATLALRSALALSARTRSSRSRSDAAARAALSSLVGAADGVAVLVDGRAMPDERALRCLPKSCSRCDDEVTAL